MRVKCLAQEHNTMSPARAPTQTARSEDERTNHEATASPTTLSGIFLVMLGRGCSIGGRTIACYNYWASCAACNSHL